MKADITTLGINLGHNGSIAVVKNNKLEYYIEEERLSRIKYDGAPIKSLIDILAKYTFNTIIVGGTNDERENNSLPYSPQPFYEHILSKYLPKNPKTDIILQNQNHHFLHAIGAFSNSGFSEANCIVVDGAGSKHTHILPNLPPFEGFETESIFKMSGFNYYKILHKYIGSNTSLNFSKLNKGIFKFGSTPQIVKSYEAVTDFLGWDGIEAGKTMGLSSYGKENPDIPNLIINGSGNKNVIDTLYPGFSQIRNNYYPLLTPQNHPQEWHKDQSKVTSIEKDLAYKIQIESQEEVAKLIELSLVKNKTNNIVLCGGYGLNCVSNYYLKKKFPNLNIYFEPMSHDGGTSVGAAYYGYYYTLQNLMFTKLNRKDIQELYPEVAKPLKSIYLGPQYTTNQYLKTLKSYNNMFNQYKITPEQVAKLISERNIVTIFQGRSEAGPRALGNRSILYDPTDPNGKDYVNKVKNREWFRPFAGSVLKEKAAEWFDMAGLEESPFMMYAMDVWPDKQEKIQAITHVDGTCRIQTVTEEQNPHYYKLIQEFEKITGVPILFNTSFNLAGDPLVETIEDALETMLKSEMKYMYVPELEMLLEKK